MAATDTYGVSDAGKINLADGLLTRLRTVRGLSQTALAELSTISDFTIRRGERDPSTLRDATWHHLLRALASVALFTPEEKLEISAATGWQTDAIETHNRTAVRSSRPADRRQTSRTRVIAVLERAEAAGLLDQFLTLVESFAAALPPPPPEPERLNPDLFKD